MGRRRRDTHALTADIDTGTARLEALPENPEILVLYVNEVPSSAIHLSDPGYLDFEYLDWSARIIDTVFPRPASLRVVHIGGAGCALARTLDATHPGSKQTAVEIDAALIAFVREHLPLPSRLSIRAADGATEITRFSPGSLDVLVRDAFDHDAVPGSLQSGDFHAACARALKPGGIAVFNVADQRPYALLRAEVSSLFDHFAHVYLTALPAQFKGRRWGNVVVTAAQRPLDEAALDRSLRFGPDLVQVMGTERTRAFLGL